MSPEQRTRAVIYARENYEIPSDNCVETDPDQQCLEVREGCWLKAWVWVPRDAYGEPEGGGQAEEAARRRVSNAPVVSQGRQTVLVS